MPTEWNHTTLEQLIKDERQENQYLDYKAADSISSAESKKTDISKDISAMANASGGVIIYGIQEKQDNKNLPGSIDPIDQTRYSKDWLANVISDNIQPRIEGLLIHPVHVGPDADHFVYVVEIPQSTTAHQARDNRYYSRYNSKSQPMTDSQIRDVMGRSQHPQIDLSFQFRHSHGGLINDHDLIITAHNGGRIYAQYVNCTIYLPMSLTLPRHTLFDRDLMIIEGKQYLIVKYSNSHRDIIVQRDSEGLQKSRSLGSTWFKPILPDTEHQWIHNLPHRINYSDLPSEEAIHWQIFADNASAKSGVTLLKDVPLVVEKETTRSVVSKQFKKRPLYYTFQIGFIIFVLLLLALYILSRIID
ncbi:MAG: ATP-binding protein [Chloroflexi bacterium]|nr:ATP-binding protein [Chloroflexota bacterium]